MLTDVANNKGKTFCLFFMFYDTKNIYMGEPVSFSKIGFLNSA